VTIQAFARGKAQQREFWAARTAAGTIQSRVRGMQLRRQLGAAEDKKMAAKLILVKHHIGEPARWDPGR